MHGLLAAGTDIWVREVARKTLGQRHVPATVSLPSAFLRVYLTVSLVFPFLDVLLSRPIFVSLNVQLVGDNAHNGSAELLSLGWDRSSYQVMPDTSPPVVTKYHCLRRSQLRKFLLFIALACSVRITNAITWAFLFPPLLWQLRGNVALLRTFITNTVATMYVHRHLFNVPLTYGTDV